VGLALIWVGHVAMRRAARIERSEP
jgi:hypothetical protein